ncbi:hypothetical protein BCR34DRAFT_594025 [Clohesyomyces aquaticus]|uniref:Uncharacterized protein n=1 Tax=Clohesyomyces aquaticus TaxID=1231657 RepID=A0A1Y1YD37_9PLEO|nr:hypothetical protein BCR34DRAFT_594025 [Clohesyomyces aquaticus]
MQIIHVFAFAALGSTAVAASSTTNCPKFPPDCILAEKPEQRHTIRLERASKELGQHSHWRAQVSTPLTPFPLKFDCESQHKLCEDLASIPRNLKGRISPPFETAQVCDSECLNELLRTLTWLIEHRKHLLSELDSVTRSAKEGYQNMILSEVPKNDRSPYEMKVVHKENPHPLIKALDDVLRGEESLEVIYNEQEELVLYMLADLHTPLSSEVQDAFDFMIRRLPARDSKPEMLFRRPELGSFLVGHDPIDIEPTLEELLKRQPIA